MKTILDRLAINVSSTANIGIASSSITLGTQRPFDDICSSTATAYPNNAIVSYCI